MIAVLVVEADFIIRIDAVDISTDAGFKVFEAADAEAALDILRDHAASIHMLFSDVQMPGSMDGFDWSRYAS